MLEPFDTPPDLSQYFRGWANPMTQAHVRGIRQHVLGVTQTELADLLGVSTNTVSRWEDERYTEARCKGPYPRLLWLIANVDGIRAQLEAMRDLDKHGPPPPEPKPAPPAPPSFAKFRSGGEQ